MERTSIASVLVRFSISSYLENSLSAALMCRSP
jgi:hypothetical protein